MREHSGTGSRRGTPGSGPRSVSRVHPVGEQGGYLAEVWAPAPSLPGEDWAAVRPSVG